MSTQYQEPISYDDSIRMPSDFIPSFAPSGFGFHCHPLDCIANPLPLLDLPIVGQSDKQAKAMMHGDEGIGVDGLKELDPGPSSHDSIHNGDIMEELRVTFTMNLYLCCLCLTTSFVLSRQQGRNQAFPLVKVKPMVRY